MTESTYHGQPCSPLSQVDQTASQEELVRRIEAGLNLARLLSGDVPITTQAQDTLNHAFDALRALATTPSIPWGREERMELDHRVAEVIADNLDVTLNRERTETGGFITLGDQSGRIVDAARQAVDAVLASLPSVSQEAIRREAARSAFLDLIADASVWDEQQDEGGIYYKLEFTDASLVPLIKALGIQQQCVPIIVDGEQFPGMESPADAIARVIAENARAPIDSPAEKVG